MSSRCFKYFGPDGHIYYVESNKIRKSMHDAERLANMLIDYKVIEFADYSYVKGLLDSMVCDTLSNNFRYNRCATLRADKYGEFEFKSNVDGSATLLHNIYSYHNGAITDDMRFSSLYQAVRFVQANYNKFYFRLGLSPYGKGLVENKDWIICDALKLAELLKTDVCVPFQLEIQEKYLGAVCWTPVIKLFPGKRFMVVIGTSQSGDSTITKSIIPTLIRIIREELYYIPDGTGKMIS